MKVICAARDIPVGSIVTKKTGEKKYELMDFIRIHGLAPEGQREIKADENTRFLVAKDMGFGITAISADSELLWEISDGDLYQFLYEKIMCDHK